MEFFNSELNSNTLAIFAFLLVLYTLFWRQYSKSAKKNLPPEAGGAWPIIGHLHLLAGPQLAHETLAAMADQHGPAFIIRLGSRLNFVVSDWEIAKELFTTYDVAVSSRPKLIAAEHMGYNYAMFGFSPYGAFWREMRKLISVELLSTRRLELLKDVRVSETETSMKELYKLWHIAQREESGNGRVLVEMKKWFADLNLNVVLRMVAGKRYFGAIDAEDEKEARRCQKAFRDFFRLLGDFVIGDFVPFVRWLDIGGHEKAMKETGKEMDSVMGEWLKEHRERRESGEAKGDQDFMDVMISKLEGEKEFGGYDPDTIIKATCMVMVSGGADTTTVMLVWALSLLMNNRDALRKVQEELDVQVGRERQVNESDISNLIYLQAVVKETLRLYPAGFLGGFREFTKDCTVAGYHVPKGTRLTVNMWKLQRDPKIWSEPHEFRPERFLTTHKDLDVKGQDYELMPFGAGRRICPGTSLGIQMMHFVLATLLHGFKLETLSKSPVDMMVSAGLTNPKATPLEVTIHPRLPRRLYN